MKHKVIFVSTANPQIFFKVDQKEFMIGRSKDCEVIVDDSSVSRVHARVKFLNGQYLLDSLGQNPTHVNGVSIK